MRKIYVLMAVAAVVLAGCKNNGSKKSEKAADAVEAVADESECAATEADAARAEIEKITADGVDGLVEGSVEELLKKNPDAVIPFQLVENKPTFEGGDANEFSKWVNKNLKYPQAAIDNNVEGRVVLSFTVDKDGSVKDVKVVSGVSELLDSEAVRVVSNSPKWGAGSQGNLPVSVKYTFPVVFKLQ